MQILRVGKVPTGAPVTAGWKEINERLRLPRINILMYRAKEILADALEYPLREYILDHKEEVVAAYD